MASNCLTEFSSIPIISERITNISTQQADLVHCPVCGYILWKPVTCSTCENSFCFQCIQIWLSEQQEQLIKNVSNDVEYDNLTEELSLIRCPFNCSPYKQRKCLPLLSLILSKLKIDCQNKRYGCQQILYYEQLEKHQEELCQYKIVQCPGCKQRMFKSIFDKDEHLLKCLDIDLQCTRCESIFKRKEKHNQVDCMEKQICLLRQDMIKFEQKSSTICDVQRRRIEILDEKINIIAEILESDEESEEENQ